MKYIRTKDGKIFEIEKDLGRYGTSKAVIICDFDGNFIDVRKQNMIHSQADTIEELCDEFVIKVKTGYLITYYDKKLLTQDANKNGADVYGAIWTDKGLIYIAKMNDKGELELL